MQESGSVREANSRKENGREADNRKENGREADNRKENGREADSRKENGREVDNRKENGREVDNRKENSSVREIDNKKENGSVREIDNKKENGSVREDDNRKENDDVRADNVLNTLTGTIPYGMTNDYMFHMVLQKGNVALRHLLSALLEVPYGEIVSCEVLNPIVLGETIDEKKCIMDVRVCLNNSRMINLEMQVGHLASWPNRALYYLCRLFCNIRSGQDYGEILSAVHIGILNEAVFPEIREFYSKYQLVNPANGHVFTGNFVLHVLNLSQTKNVSGKMRSTELYLWASLFKATTWEEVRALAEKNEGIREAANFLHELTEDEKVQLECEGRDRYYSDMNSARGDGRREGLAKGRAEGRKEGRAEGREEGRNEMNALIQRLTTDGRTDDLVRSSMDSAFQEKLLKEYKIGRYAEPV